MSKVMQQLKHSERGHLASGLSGSQTVPLAAPRQKRGWTLRYVSLALVPPILIAVGVTLDTYQSQKQSWLESNVSQTVSIEVPFEYHVKPAPDFGSLAVTYRQPSDLAVELVEAELDSEPLPEQPMVINETPVIESENGQADLLQDLDLSGLSPELAERFEAVLNSTPKVEQTDSDSMTSNLSHQAERWYGKLPAMNFQTHVYSSMANKRWVKINGAEYGEGDWISGRVELVAIEPQACLIRFNGELITVPALYDWQG
ncbi:general secretion pathway protein GspB [Vibrio sp. JPW-9-11-11]|uniref:general secretion pathway protein GspB n=1 Tax=Vibrio sp. JPW-9-11-11 TaxID=1416532 RepID=UPI0015939C3E|nr:general secretion pathway protein GspB [Vibrio sp. JPW-9-11-11]NVD07481.1 general secretion pathway protein GspB [Vibrio sp. JPW-9-11-11]